MRKKPFTHTFRKAITVLRYVPQQIKWHKAEYRALATHLPNWEKEVQLTNGCVRQGQLWLRHDLLETIEQLPSDTLVLHGLHSASWIELFHRRHTISFFLKLHKKYDEIWLELCDEYYPFFGSKKRDDFEIMPLLPGKSVAVHINARYWHSMTGRTDTYYLENYLYLENLGTFEQATLLEGLEEHFEFLPEKEIDLRQMMY